MIYDQVIKAMRLTQSRQDAKKTAIGYHEDHEGHEEEQTEK